MTSVVASRQDRGDARAGELHARRSSARWFDAGADVFRLNFSHGSHDEHRARYDIIREIEQEVGRPIGVLADLQGPKLRVGRLAHGPITLAEARPLRFDLDPTPGDAHRVPLPHPEVFAALAPGVQLLLDDGKLRLEVEEAGAEFGHGTRRRRRASCPTARASASSAPYCRSRR